MSPVKIKAIVQKCEGVVPILELKKITFDNFESCIALEPNENQKSFVASNVLSLAEAYVALDNHECIPMPYVICHDEIPVGFIMLSFNHADEDNAEDAYWVWRFMIDKRYQGKGYGKKAMARALELIRTFPHGKAGAVCLSYEPENEVAKSLYASFGFVETGKIQCGEMIATLSLQG